MDPANNPDESYKFISETIKKRPVNKRRVFLKVLFTFFLAVLFGVVASFTYVLLLPRVEEFVSANEVNFIKLKEPADNDEIAAPADGTLQGAVKEDKAASPADTAVYNEEKDKEADNKEPDPTDNGDDSEAVKDDAYEHKDGPEENTVTQAVLNDEVLTEEPDANEDSSGQEDPDSKEDIAVTISGQSIQAGSVVDKQFEINDYTLLYQKIEDVADEIKKCIVTVTAVHSDRDWFQNPYESKDQTSGVILADNGKELLILVRTSVIEEADDIQVTFYDGNRYPAVLKKSDKNTGLSVAAIELSRIEEGTGQSYKMAELGNSRARSVKGKPVIAIGDPIGVIDSIAIGQITSSSIVVDKIDSNVSLLTTDIYGSTNASGILCDFDGKILGIICHDGNNPDIKNLIRAYSISDLKSTIEKILNGQDIACLGIQGTDVTDEISEAYDIPKGAYVTQVVSDSPAMKAGIQNGDVIVKLGTNEISSFTDYREAMLKCQPKDTTAVTIKRMGREEYVDISYEVVLGKL